MTMPNITCIIVATALLLAWPVVATAQDEAEPAEIEVHDFGAGRDGHLPDQGGYSPPWAAIIFGLLSVVVILAPAFKSARRTHLN